MIKIGGIAPPNMVTVTREIDSQIPGATFSGIVSGSGWGYHNSPRTLSNRYGDYSNQLSLDRDQNPNYSSAFDMSFTAAQQTVVTQRLLTACQRKDPRLFGMREFCGSINGRITGYDRSNNRIFHNWDSTHTWHIHVSMYRKYCNDLRALQGVRDVMLGRTGSIPAPTPQPAPKEDIDSMSSEAELKALNEYLIKGTRYGQSATAGGGQYIGTLLSILQDITEHQRKTNELLQRLLDTGGA